MCGRASAAVVVAGDHLSGGLPSHHDPRLEKAFFPPAVRCRGESRRGASFASSIAKPLQVSWREIAFHKQCSEKGERTAIGCAIADSDKYLARSVRLCRYGPAGSIGESDGKMGKHESRNGSLAIERFREESQVAAWETHRPGSRVPHLVKFPAIER